MPSDGSGRVRVRDLLPMLALLPILLGSGGRASPMNNPGPLDDTNQRYVTDLSDPDKSDRLYAARVLRSRLGVVLRDASRGRPGSMRQDEAFATLDDYETQVAPACIDALAIRNVSHHCAAILGMLAHDPATEPLNALLAPEASSSRRARKQAIKALEAIQAAAL